MVLQLLPSSEKPEHSAVGAVLGSTLEEVVDDVALAEPDATQSPC